MKITSLTLRNVACFEDVSFSLGSIVLIQSANGLGKSSLIAALKFLFGRGHDADLLRAGTEKGEIIAVFDDGAQVRAALTTEKTDRMYKPAGQRRWDRGREFIETVSNALSYDPLLFLQKSDRDQVSDLLRLMPIAVAPEEIAAALVPIESQPHILDGLDLVGRSPLDVVNTIRKAVYEARTTVHVAADTHEKHAGELEESLKAMNYDGTDWGAEVRKLQVQVAGIDGAEERLKERLSAELRTFIAEQEGGRDKSILIEEQRVEREVSMLREKLAGYKRNWVDVTNKAIADERVLCREKLDAFISQQADDRTRLTASLAQAEQSYAMDLKLQSTKDAITEAKKQASVKRTEWKAMTACLENIDKLKSEVASRLPIPCTIADGRICREENGALVPLSKWNDASRWALALKIATLCHGQAGFVCIDSAGFDAFDPSNRSAFLAACQKYVDTEGMQFVLATVSDSDLKVTEVTS